MASVYDTPKYKKIAGFCSQHGIPFAVRGDVVTPLDPMVMAMENITMRDTLDLSKGEWWRVVCGKVMGEEGDHAEYIVAVEIEGTDPQSLAWYSDEPSDSIPEWMLSKLYALRLIDVGCAITGVGHRMTPDTYYILED